MEDCPHTIRKNRGLTEWFECSIDSTICPFARRCPNLNKVVSTANSLGCIKRKNDKK